MEKMILRWTGCGHDIEFPRPLCGGETLSLREVPRESGPRVQGCAIAAT